MEESKAFKKLNIFISHHHRDASIGIKLKECIDSLFLQQHEIFLSSDMAPGHDWFKKIIEFLEKEAMTLVLTTRDSIKRPWVWFEVGASWYAKKIVIPICFKGVTKKNLPEPLSRLTALNLRPRDLVKLFETIAVHSNCRLEKKIINDTIKNKFSHIFKKAARRKKA